MRTSVLLIVLQLVAVSLALTFPHISHERCSCSNGAEKIGDLCYSPCPSGTIRSGVDCISVCPDFMKDEGVFCKAIDYSRGAGFPWKFGDSSQISRCEAQHGQGNCEKSGVIYYPKCKEGYYASGCCICKARSPDCDSLDLDNAIDVYCTKRAIASDKSSPNC